ncbi:MAG: FecCD family ABC transporter permease [Phycisphaerae bacterium]
MNRLTPARYFITLGVFAVGVVAVLLISPGIGTRSSQIGLSAAWHAFLDGDTQSDAYWIGFGLRLPRTMLALEAGITLGLCGAVFQSLFRNPLATPYTLGIASGGSLGALLAIKLGIDLTLFGLSGRMLCAFAGSLVVIGLIVLFTRGGRRIGTTELLLAGVTIGLFCSAMVLFITYLSDEWQTFSMVRWMMGSLVTVSVGESLRGLPLLLPSWIVLIACGRSLNQYLLGEELAASRGVNLARLRWVCILFASLSTAVVVALCGPIGFVGLVVPQITSLCVGRDRRLLLPASALAGGVFLAVCDWISQCGLGWAGALVGHQLGSAILPIGVVTAIVGVPIFLVLLYRRASTWVQSE